jgi:hypothetical protein
MIKHSKKSIIYLLFRLVQYSKALHYELETGVRFQAEATDFSRRYHDQISPTTRMVLGGGGSFSKAEVSIYC